MAHWFCKVCDKKDPCRLDMGKNAIIAPKRCVLDNGDASTPDAKWELGELLAWEGGIADAEPVTDCNQLPDWVKKNVWVYLSWAKEYDKITDICKDYVRTDKNGWFGNIRITTGTIMQARLRPFNGEEMKALVGKVIATTKDAALVVGYRGSENKVIIGCSNNSFYFSAERLLEYNATLDEKPCGVLEHLENGEWVK